MYVNVYTYENDIPQRLLTCQTSASIPQFDTQTYMAISSGGTWQRISVPKSGKDVSGESIFLLAGNLEHWWPSTPWKINMEPANQPFRSENHLPNHHFQVQAVHLPGCIFRKHAWSSMGKHIHGILRLASAQPTPRLDKRFFGQKSSGTKVPVTW